GFELHDFDDYDEQNDFEDEELVGEEEDSEDWQSETDENEEEMEEGEEEVDEPIEMGAEVGERNREDEEHEEERKAGKDEGDILQDPPPPAAYFTCFVDRIVRDSMIVLWPESTAMVLARFLADNDQYKALLAYCHLNEPYLKELCSAFRFFEGIALIGLKEPEKAMQSFLDAVEGVRREDQALNRTLNTRGVDPSRPFTVVKYILKVMTIVERHGFPDLLVRLSRIALREAERDRTGVERFLPKLHVNLFKSELRTEQYEEAMKSILNNPYKDNARTCLREMMAKLVEQKLTNTIVEMFYFTMEREAVEILREYARASNVKKDGFFYELLYAFHMHRSSFQRVDWISECKNLSI
ncbi:unnamed protein product, partial [Gongylonema pulchrum]|uniref:Programmed cell death protein n=1 Tax=Gongylonema pulchrum TaxID=637853 RepID=A0A183D388_9BILA